MTVTYQNLVRREITDICKYYDDRSSGLGDRFLREMLGCVEEIKLNPLRWPPIADSKDKRKARLRNFPYVLIYRVVDEQTLRILIVKHSRRDPNLGMGRD